MKKLLLPLLFIIASCGTNTKNNPNLNRDLGEPLLKNAVDIVAKRLYASWPQYDYHDYSTQYKIIDDTLYLYVVMNKVGGNAKATLYFKSFTDNSIVVEAAWIHGYDYQVQELYSVIFKKNGAEWENQIANNAFIDGTIENELDLDGNGTSELIVKSVITYSKEAYTGGRYNLFYLNAEGKFEPYYEIHLGNYQEYKNSTEKNIKVELKYLVNQGITTIESLVSSVNNQQVVKGLFSWNGERLIQENAQADQLTIEGKDIMMWASQDTGTFVMKLNQGDKCKILYKGKLNSIQGVLDCWYNIDYNGTIGWVFGSGTNLKCGNTPLKTVKQVWDFFVKTYKEDCQNRLEKDMFNDYQGGCEFKETLNSFSIVQFTEDGFDKNEYVLRKVIEDKIFLINHIITVGAASLCTKYYTIPFIFNEYWQLVDNDSFEGDLDTVYQFPDNKILFVTHSKDNCNMDLFLKFDSKTKINLYLVDKQAKPMVSKIQELDKHEYNNDDLEDLAEGTLFIDSVGIDYFFELSPIRLKLSEFKRRKVGENYERVSDATKIEIYQWDNQQNKFILIE